MRTQKSLLAQRPLGARPCSARAAGRQEGRGSPSREGHCGLEALQRATETLMSAFRISICCKNFT